MNKVILVFVIVVIASAAVTLSGTLQGKSKQKALIEEFYSHWNAASQDAERLILAQNLVKDYSNIKLSFVGKLVPSEAKASEKVCRDLDTQISMSKTFSYYVATEAYTQVKTILKCSPH